MSSSSTSASLKTRHYAQLASRLNHLQANLESTEVEMELMSKQLVSMAKLGAWCGSQFMATSRLLDIDLERQTAQHAEKSASQEQQ